MTTAKVLDGQKFGKLTVLHREPKPWSHRTFWRCVCDCGTECVKMGKYLTNGNTRSCGCEQREMRARGNAKYGAITARRDYPREYRIWRSMKSRCLTESSSNYRFYGGRGITVCAEWADDFSVFLRDMGPCPGDYTIDRIDPNGHYEPSNCRWATWNAQRNNTRRTAYVDVGGAPTPLSSELRRLGLSHAYQAIYDRTQRLGMSLDEAIQDANQAIRSN